MGGSVPLLIGWTQIPWLMANPFHIHIFRTSFQFKTFFEVRNYPRFWRKFLKTLSTFYFQMCVGCVDDEYLPILYDTIVY